MIGLIEIIVEILGLMIFLEQMGIPVSDVIASLKDMFGIVDESESTTAAPEV